MSLRKTGHVKQIEFVRLKNLIESLELWRLAGIFNCKVEVEITLL